MKLFIISIFSFFLLSCGGRDIRIYDFNRSKFDVQSELLNIINKDSTYVVPNKWKIHTEGDYFERIYVYFKNSPEELYQIGFADSASWSHSTTCRLGLVSIYQGNQFKYVDDLSGKEIDRITKQFEVEILSKVKYSYYKIDY